MFEVNSFIEDGSDSESLDKESSEEECVRKSMKSKNQSCSKQTPTMTETMAAIYALIEENKEKSPVLITHPQSSRNAILPKAVPPDRRS